jgi:hypothetical protein
MERLWLLCFCRYVQHWDLTDAVIVVKQEDGEEEPSCGLCTSEISGIDNASFTDKHDVADHQLPAGAISSVLTDGGGTDSHLSSHMTNSQSVYTAQGGSEAAIAESSQLTSNAISSRLHPLSAKRTSVANATSSGGLASRRLQPTDGWLPRPDTAAVPVPVAVADVVAAAVPEVSEVAERPQVQPHVAHGPAADLNAPSREGQEDFCVSSAAASIHSQMHMATDVSVGQRTRLRLDTGESHISNNHDCSRTTSQRHNECSIDFDLTDALMSKDMSKARNTNSGARQAPPVADKAAVPSFVDEDALDIALGVLFARYSGSFELVLPDVHSFA